MKAEEIASSIWMSRCHLHGEDTRGYNMISPKYESPRCEPWCWYIYLQNWLIFRVNVDKPFHTAYGIEHEGFKIRKIGN